MESTESEILMDEVAEERPVEKKKSYLGAIIFLVVIALIASATWYFQSTWMPHAKQSYQQAQTMMHDFMSSEKIDPMAAPAMSSHIPADDSIQNEASSEVIISAVINDEKKEAGLKEVVPEVEVQEKSTEIEVTAEIEKTTGTEDIVQENQETAINEAELIVEMHNEPEEMAVTNNVLKAEPNVIEEEIAVLKENLANSDEAKKLSMPVVKHDAGVIMQDAEAVKSEAELAAARQAFWQRDLPKAEILYKEQINNSKANANSWGELGNIYYLQAKWQQAAFAYTEAALILLDKGDFPQAMFLRYIVTGLDPAQVKRIDERLRKLQSPA